MLVCHWEVTCMARFDFGHGIVSLVFIAERRLAFSFPCTNTFVHPILEFENVGS